MQPLCQGVQRRFISSLRRVGHRGRAALDTKNGEKRGSSRRPEGARIERMWRIIPQLGVYPRRGETYVLLDCAEVRRNGNCNGYVGGDGGKACRYATFSVN